MKRNVPILGFFIGLILPLIGLLVMYLIRFKTQYSFPDFLGILWRQRQVASSVFSLSLLANIIPFIYYTNKRLDHTARGILVITILYAVVCVLLKFNFFM
jgi:hypothetical protein